MLRKMCKALLLCVMLGLAAPRLALGDWKEPADKKFTEQELKDYLAATKEWLTDYVQIMQQVNDSTTTAGKISVAQQIDAKHQEVLNRYHFTESEYNWLGDSITEAWGVANALGDPLIRSQQDLDDRKKENEEKLADAKKHLQIYLAAQASGTRVLTPEDRDNDIKAAQDDLKSALEEVKQHNDDAKSAEDEAKQHDTDAAQDLAQANYPPSDVSADDRDGFIQTKKNDAQNAQDAATEARDREAAARKDAADAQARADAAQKRVDHPEIPQSDDDKAAVKTENDTNVQQAKSEIDDCIRNEANYVQFQNQLEQTKQQVTDEAPPENVELMRKYGDQYKDVLETASRLQSTTQPIEPTTAK